MCERAQRTEDGHGYVSDDEVLWHFVTSTSGVDAKKPVLRPKVLDRVFSSGLSTVRYCRVTDQELDETAREQFDYHSAKNEEFGGLLGVLSFTASKVRSVSSSNLQPYCCVLDTPTESKKCHADVVFAHVEESVAGNDGVKEFRTAQRVKLFNAIGGLKAFISADEIDPEFNLSKYHPKCYDGAPVRLPEKKK